MYIERSGGSQRATGLRATVRQSESTGVWHARVLFRGQAHEFRHADLRRFWAALTGRNESDVSQGAIAYQRRRLRLHGLIERAPHTHRYRVTPIGLRAAQFCTRSYTRLLRPGLAFALPGHRAIATPLKRAVDNLETELQASMRGTGEPKVLPLPGIERIIPPGVGFFPDGKRVFFTAAEPGHACGCMPKASMAASRFRSRLKELSPSQSRPTATFLSLRAVWMESRSCRSKVRWRVPY